MAEKSEIETLRDRLRLHLKWTERYKEAALRTSDLRCARMAEEHAAIVDDISEQLNAMGGCPSQ